MSIEKEINDYINKVIYDELPDILRNVVHNALAKQTLTTSQVEELYGLNSSQQYRLRKNGKLTFIQDGGKILYYRSSIEEYLSDHTIDGLY